MNNIEGNISIEQFAAFLDGNLPEKEMQNVADIIDSDSIYADIVSYAIDVDNAAEVLANDTNILPDELQSADFELPVIPAVDALGEDIEVLPVTPVVQDTTEVVAIETDTDHISSLTEADDQDSHPQVTTLPTEPSQDTETLDAHNNATSSIYDDNDNPETIDIV